MPVTRLGGGGIVYYLGTGAFLFLLAVVNCSLPVQVQKPDGTKEK